MEPISDLLETVTGSAVLVDPNGVVLAASVSALQAFGAGSGTFIGDAWADHLAAAPTDCSVFSLSNWPREPKQMDARIEELEEEVVRLRELVTRDSLTGLLNRRGLESALQRETARSSRYGRELTIVMVGVVGVAQVNEQFGHFAGDAALRAVADRIHARVRRADFVGRWGGEEFMLLLPETDEAGGRLVAADLEDAISSLPLEAALGGEASIGAYCGVAAIEPGARDDGTSLVPRVDAALRLAKQRHSAPRYGT